MATRPSGFLEKFDARAQSAGADGVFLINHVMTDAELLAIHESVADAFPGGWVGFGRRR